MKIMSFLFFVLFCFCTYAQEMVATPEISEDLKGLVWNKWDTENFIILSIDKNQGLQIKNNIENAKTLLLTKWGLPDVDFEGECKIICVSNKALLKKIFRLDESKVEIRRDQQGNIKLCVIWFYLDEEMPLDHLSSICLAQFEQKHDKLPYFCKKGMPLLSKSSDDIRQKLLSEENLKFSIKEFFSIKEDKANSESYKVKSALLCLLLRKEFGQDNFINFLHSKSLSSFGFEDDGKFEKTVNKYYENIYNDLKENKVPDNYLEINNRR
jgi:hypothetical protein